MSNSNKNQTGASARNNSTDTLETEVLYQKLGDTWFAFTIINDEVFMSPVAENKIEEIRRENHESAA